MYYEGHMIPTFEVVLFECPHGLKFIRIDVYMSLVALRKVAMDVIEGNRMLLDIHYCQHVYRGDGCVKYDCMELRDDNDVEKIFFLF